MPTKIQNVTGGKTDYFFFKLTVLFSYFANIPTWRTMLPFRLTYVLPLYQRYAVPSLVEIGQVVLE